VTDTKTAATDAKTPPEDTRTPSQIEADIVATRERLAGRIAELKAHTAPKAIGQRQAERVKGLFVDEFGGVRPERVLAAAGVVVAILALGAMRRRRSRD
jgi:Protein of unknown function (DUF3618)